MFDFSKIENIDLSTESILSKISDAEIFTYYFGPFKMNKVYQAKHRKDRSPSVGFYLNVNNDIILNDFATGEKFNCFNYVQKITGLKFKDVLEKIAKDFGIINGSTRKVSKEISIAASQIDKTKEKKYKKIQFLKDSWKKKYLDYWNIFGITKEELIVNNVYPVKKVFVDKLEYLIYRETLTFALHEPSIGVKIYCPKSNDVKFITNIPINVPFGLNDLDFSDDTIIVSKSKKDQIILKKFFKNVIATQNESIQAINDETLSIINKFKNKVLFWDADKTGIEMASYFKEQGLYSITTPLEEYEKNKIKDPGDFVTFYGLDFFQDFLKKDELLCQKLSS